VKAFAKFLLIANTGVHCCHDRCEMLLSNE